MNGASPAMLAEAITATWPPASVQDFGPFRVAKGEGGGNRVSAARLRDAVSDGASVSIADIDAAAEEQRAIGQDPLFMVFDWQNPLDRLLAAEGYATRDATDMLCSNVATVAAAPPPVTCFDIWPPLAVQEEIWAAGGIGPARLAIMHRAVGTKTTIFGRMKDRPAGTAFVAIHDGIAMLHAVEIAQRARRQGLARTMVQAAGHWAARRGASLLATLVTKENVAAQALYASLGLQPVGQYHYRAK